MVTAIWVNIAWNHQAITRIDISLSSNVFCSIHMRTNTPKGLMNSIPNMNMEITLFHLQKSFKYFFT